MSPPRLEPTVKTSSRIFAADRELLLALAAARGEDFTALMRDMLHIQCEKVRAQINLTPSPFAQHSEP